MLLRKKLFAISLFAIALILFAAGCRKDAPASLPGNVTISMVKMTVSNSVSGVPDTFVYTYDSLGRQISSTTDTNVVNYTYSSGSVLMTHHLAGEQFITSYTLNSLGLATSDSKGDAYSYDSLGYLTEYIDAGSGINYDTTFYTIAGGGVDTSVEHQVATGTNNVITTAYTYLPTIDSRNYGLAFLGKQNTYLVSTQSITQVISGAVYTISYTYSYTFDSQGRVIQQVESSGSATYTTTYTYY